MKSVGNLTFSMCALQLITNHNYFFLFCHLITENGRPGKVAEGKERMAEVYKKRGSHTEEATIPGNV